MALKPQPDFKKLEAGATPFNDDNFKLDEAYIWAAAEEGTERQNEMVATFGEKDEAGNKKNWKRISQFDDFKKLHLFKGRDAAGK